MIYSKTYSNVKSGFSVGLSWKSMLYHWVIMHLQSTNLGVEQGTIEWQIMWIPYRFNMIFFIVFQKNCFWVQNLSLSSMLHFAALCLWVSSAVQRSNIWFCVLVKTILRILLYFPSNIGRSSVRPNFRARY